MSNSSYNRPIPSTPLTRPSTTTLAPPDDASFLIKAADKSYKHQYSNIYFVRLRALRQQVEQRAKRRWNEVAGTSQIYDCDTSVGRVNTCAGNPVFVPRVLEVEKGKLCFVIGTVYMEMPLKPNVLEDIARDVSGSISVHYYPPTAFDADVGVAIPPCTSSEGEVLL